MTLPLGLGELKLDATLTYTIITSFIIALLYFYGKMYLVGKNDWPRERYIIYGLQFFLLYAIIPLAFYSTNINNKVNNLIHDSGYKFVLSHTLHFVLIQFMCLILVEQGVRKLTTKNTPIKQEDKISDFIKNIPSFIINIPSFIKFICVKLQEVYLFKYLIIMIIVLFEYPSYVFGYNLTISPNLSNFAIFLLSIVVVFFGLAQLATFLGTFEQKVLGSSNSQLNDNSQSNDNSQNLMRK